VLIPILGEFLALELGLIGAGLEAGLDAGFDTGQNAKRTTGLGIGWSQVEYWERGWIGRWIRR